VTTASFPRHLRGRHRALRIRPRSALAVFVRRFLASAGASALMCLAIAVVSIWIGVPPA
jgi:hypothetical protein